MLILSLCFFLLQMSCSKTLHPERETSNSPPLFYSQSKDPYFGYSQDMDSYLKYQDMLLNPSKDIPAQTGSTVLEKKLKQKTVKRKNKVIASMSLNSHFIKKVKAGKRLIKISISNLETSSGPDEISTQYVVEDTSDELLNATEELVDKIVRRLSDVIRS